MTDEQEQLLDDWYHLNWGVERSILYHSHRADFYGMTHRVPKYVSVVTGTAALAFIVKSQPLVGAWLGVFGAITSSGDLVFRLAEKERLHLELKQKFQTLLSEMRGPKTQERLVRFLKVRDEIEDKEPSKMFALDVACHNELLQSRGLLDLDPTTYRHDLKTLTSFQFRTRNLFRWISLGMRLQSKPK